MSHLLGGCKRCLAGLAPAAGVLLSPEPVPEEDFELPIRRAFEAVARHGVEALAIKASTRKLHRQMATKGLEAVSLKSHPDVAIFEALLLRMQDLRHEDPRSMVQHGQIAVQTAKTMAKSCPAKEHADLQTRAYAELANALRVADELPEALKHLEEAEQWYTAGTQCDLLWLRLLDVRASLYGAQQHYQSAIDLLEEVFQGRLRLGDHAGAARALIGKAVFTGYSGNLEAELLLLDQGSALLESRNDPKIQSLLHHNKLYVLVELGRYFEAFAHLDQHRLWLGNASGRLGQMKLLGLEARIHAGLGHFDLAEALLQEAKLGLSVLEVRGHEALAGLDLATVILRQDPNRYIEAVTLAVESLATFTQLRVKPQVIEALTVLAHAIKDSLLTATLLQSIADFVRKAEHDRRARYQLRFE
jgi:tetratricopeptide (TPR) repeat protein